MIIKVKKTIGKYLIIRVKEAKDIRWNSITTKMWNDFLRYTPTCVVIVLPSHLEPLINLGIVPKSIRIVFKQGMPMTDEVYIYENM